MFYTTLTILCFLYMKCLLEHFLFILTIENRHSIEAPVDDNIVRSTVNYYFREIPLLILLFVNISVLFIMSKKQYFNIECLELSVEEELAVDEAMIPYTGKLSVKQYVKGKPPPWGIKMYMLCGKRGQAYDFILYQGASTEFETSLLKLFQALKQEKICAAGTVRVNRFANLPLIPDKEAMKKERGFSEEIFRADDIILVKWVDNKTVVLGSNFTGKGEIDKVERWDKKESKYVTIARPELVKCYNHGMGGVDLFDQLMPYYRIFIKSKKWTLRAIFHAVDFAVVQRWLEYRKNANAVGLPTKKIMDLLDFRMKLADVLVLSGMDTSNRKWGRPSATPPDTPVQR
ncbi:piggyBac transposable element-derived protein 3-like [Schistocerca piceifrons]|uniref:piggyBac transposable element-derived protein 3-like n=1 Tax=Schistocerca piceifrons TaxID=274613 RepID=UPI001F5E7DEA|nr:piggyBac transposable element-derived protein 3-like [Schistocerca piceifrons]